MCPGKFENKDGMKKHLEKEHLEVYKTFYEEHSDGDDEDEGDRNDAEENNDEDAGSKNRDAGTKKS
jgi:hypothetical protein